jgi:cell division protein FtsZ
LEFLVVNTDLQALHASPCTNKLQVGVVETRGLGTGGDPQRGRKAAEEDGKTLEDHILGVDMLFITAGMGGGTGTGAAPILARLARSLDILTVAVVTTPFKLEGRPRMSIADSGIDALRQEVDTLIIVPNEKLLEILEPTTPMQDAYRAADEVLYQATRGISELITIAGVMNRDFADVRSVMKRKGNALMGIGVASGENRAHEAAKQAISNRLLEDVSIHGAEAVLVNVAGGEKMGLGELSAAVSLVQDAAGEDAHIYLGNVIDPNLGDEVRVTVVATGFGENGHGGNGSKPDAAETLAEAVEEPAEPLVEAPQEMEVPAVDSPDVAKVSRSLERDAQAPAPMDPVSLPLWNVDTEVRAETLVQEEVPAVEEREPVLPLPITAAGAPADESWTQRMRRHALDIPAFRRRLAR